MTPHWVDGDLDFDAAAERVIEAHESDGRAKDLPVLDLRQWAVVPSKGAMMLAPVGGHHEPRAMRRTAFAHLMARVGAPGEFIRDRLTAPLQLATINFLLAEQPEPLSATLRLRGQDISAVVSERYAPLDQSELLSSIRDALVQNDMLHAARVKSFATGLVDVVRLVFPTEQVAIKVGDISAVGLDISTSSFGKSAVHVRGVIWRLLCTNGLRVAQRGGNLSLRHVGDPQRLRDGVAEAIPSALAHARGVMDRWRASVHVMVHDIAQLIDDARELTIGERRLVSEEVKKENGGRSFPERLDLYTLVNAFTAAAHEATPARRLDIESVAGELLVRHTKSP